MIGKGKVVRSVSDFCRRYGVSLQMMQGTVRMFIRALRLEARCQSVHSLERRLGVSTCVDLIRYARGFHEKTH